MDNIGISLSGGGLRAASFGMGCLSYLDHLKYEGRPLLDRVRYASSTSGGSVVLAYHAVRSYAGVPFAEIFRSFHADVAGTVMLEEAVRRLNDGGTWETQFPGKTRNLINAFAVVYHRHLLKQATLGDLLDGPKNGAGPVIEELCFNSTELFAGRSFRWKVQARKEKPHEPGNDTLRFAPDAGPVLRKIRLGDVVAASACFPGGFEPIVFPDDYAASEGELDRAVYVKGDKARKPVRFGLMDGGIVDNQGLYGLKLEADKRKPPFSLLLLCDVSGPSITPFDARRESPSWARGWRVKHVVRLFVLGLLALVAGIVVAAREKAWVALIAIAAGLLMCTGAVLLIKSVLPGQKRKVKDADSTGMPEAADDDDDTDDEDALLEREHVRTQERLASAKQESPSPWDVALKKFAGPTLLNLRLDVLRQLLDARLRSVGLLVGDLFMKEIRRRHYGDLYKDQDYTHRLNACLVYELTGWNDAMRRRRWPDHTVSDTLREQAEQAARMETTLWFTDADNGMLNALLITGQATMCWCLLAHLHERTRDGAPALPGQEELRAALEAAWQRFNEAPSWLLDGLLKP